MIRNWCAAGIFRRIITKRGRKQRDNGNELLIRAL
jgi:hypothetical protein